MKLLTLSILAIAAMSAPALAACRDFPIVTPDNAPVQRVGFGAATDSSGSSASGGSNYSSLLALCHKPEHRFYATMTETGACTRTGSELMTMVGTVSASPTVAYVTLDGVVADIERHRNGIAIPAIPALNIPATFIPTTGYIPGAC